MAVSFFGKKKKYKDINYLELTPFTMYGHEMKDDGLLDVLVPKFTDKILGKYLQPRLRHKYIRANLDEFGSATWQLINGKNRVFEIAEKLTYEFGEKVQPVNERLTLFLTQLHKYNFISFKEFQKGTKYG